MNNKVKTKLNSAEFREYDEGNVAEILYDFAAKKPPRQQTERLFLFDYSVVSAF